MQSIGRPSVRHLTHVSLPVFPPRCRFSAPAFVIGSEWSF